MLATLLACFAVVTAAAPTATTGLVAAYSFDAGSGTTLSDLSGSGNTETISGATWTTAGRNGGALSFDGVNDMVTIASSSSIDLSSRLTLEAWVRPSSLGSNWRTVVLKERPGFLNYPLYAHDGGPGPSGHVYVGGQDRYSPAGAITTNTWTHLATTYDGSAVRLYVNGALATTLTTSGSIGTSTGPLRIGGNTIWPEWFAGLIDDVRIYNRALSASEIASDMNTPVAGGSSPPPSDTQAPTTPTGLTATGATQTSISVSWSTSTDNVGVTGYGRYLNNALAATGAGTTHTFSGLACGTGYTLAVDAYDAAANRSGKAQVFASTVACSSPPPSGATLFVSPSGSDTNPCSQAQRCRTFNRAYRAATPGATVEVAGGSYGGETIAIDGAKTSGSDVLFRPAAGASVNLTGQITVSGAHMELRDMTIHQVNFNPSADDVTLRNVINHGMWWQGSSNISIIGGEITCPTCNYHSHMQNGGSPLKAPTNILFDGVYFHDWMSQAGEHVECLQILGADNVTIRNSTFKNCATGNGGRGATASLHLQAYGTGPLPKNILLENNFFYPSGNMYTIQGEDFENFDMRYNSLSAPILLYNGPSAGTGMDFVGNILRASPCTAQNNAAPINWRYNVIQGGTCGPTDRNAASGFVDPNNNLHLAAGAAARNAGDPSSYPGRDIDAQSRPLGGAPDAGADEAG